VGNEEITSIGWLPFLDRVKYFSLVHVFKIKNLLAPLYLSGNFKLIADVHSHRTRQNDVIFSLAHCCHPVRTFTRSAITYWNALPSGIKQVVLVKDFKKRLKAHLSGDEK
jgi:hypothetical protein